MALTRQKLLAAAAETFFRVGYGRAKIEQIAAAAGLTRGAFYAHFPTKQVAFFALVADTSSHLVPGLIDAIQGAAGIEEAVRSVCHWANNRSNAPDFGLLMIEALRELRQSGGLGTDHFSPMRATWTAIGDALLSHVDRDRVRASPEEIGAIVLELSYAPALTPEHGPTPGRLLEITLTAILGDTHERTE